MFPEYDILAQIEKFCIEHELRYIEGITEFCEQNGLEVELIAHLIKKDPLFLVKIELEAKELRVVKRTTSAVLPI